MFKKILLGVAGSILIFSVAAFAFTPDEVKANTGKQTTERKLRVKDHAQANRTSAIMSNGINKEHGPGKVATAANAPTGGNKYGTPGKATKKGPHNMDSNRNGNRHHDRGMDHAINRDMTHNHMGSGQGMAYGSGMNHGSHMGYGAGSGMGPGMGPGMGGGHR